jgi:hypothetical protein
MDEVDGDLPLEGEVGMTYKPWDGKCTTRVKLFVPWNMNK